MADSNPTGGTPSKATTPAKKTMAPAARSPEGADDDRGSWLNRSLQGVGADDLQTLRNRIDRELRRRAAEPDEPSFGVSAGTAAELDERERRIAAGEDPDKIVVTSPFTGRKLDENGNPIEEDDDEKR